MGMSGQKQNKNSPPVVPRDRTVPQKSYQPMRRRSGMSQLEDRMMTEVRKDIELRPSGS
jgi:hypothetical protein